MAESNAGLPISDLREMRDKLRHRPAHNPAYRVYLPQSMRAWVKAKHGFIPEYVVFV